jgi:hypothetical protein
MRPSTECQEQQIYEKRERANAAGELHKAKRSDAAQGVKCRESFSERVRFRFARSECGGPDKACLAPA